MLDVPTKHTSEQGDLKKRFEAVRKSIRDAANGTLIAVRMQEPRQFEPSGASAGSTENPPLLENDDPKASFALGVSLFRQETSSVERELRSKLDKVEAELSDLVVTHQQQPSTITDENDDPNALEMEAKELTHQIAFLKECSIARSNLNEASTHDDWVESAKLLAKAQTAFSNADAMIRATQHTSSSSSRVEAANTVLESLRLPLRQKRVDLLHRADTLIETCVVLSSNSIEVKPPVEAHDVLQTLGAPPDAVLRVAAKVEREIFQPLFDHHRGGSFSGSWIFREYNCNGETEQSKKALVHGLEWKNRQDHDEMTGSECVEEKQIEMWGNTLNLIQRIMCFVREQVLLQRPALCEIMGGRLFGKGSSPNSLNLDAFGLKSNLIGVDGGTTARSILGLMWDTCVPSCRWSPDDLARLPKMAETLKGFFVSFEKSMAEHQFTSSNSQLSDFCSDFERKYSEKRRCDILQEARDLLLESDYHNTTEVGVEIKQGQSIGDLDEDDGMSIFKLHKCSVSKTASRLYELCRGTMDEAVESSLDIVSPTLYRTAREMLDLFRSIIPAAHGSDVANIPRTNAVFHNDCVFLAHQCLTLGLEFKEKFANVDRDGVRGRLLHQSCIFVDMVPPFRELANRSMGDMIEKQQSMLVEIVASKISLLGNALQSNESLMEWTDAETALTAGISHLRGLSQAWKPILSNEVYAGSLGHLVDTVFSLYLDRVLEAKAISEPACHFVSGIFRKAIRNMSTLVESSRLWNRFAAVGKFMDMSLVEIQSALAEGVFQDVTGPELSRLIMATFDSSEKRSRLLQALASDQ